MPALYENHDRGWKTIDAATLLCPGVEPRPCIVALENFKNSKLGDDASRAGVIEDAFHYDFSDVGISAIYRELEALVNAVSPSYG